jgi:hypothetical protein
MLTQSHDPLFAHPCMATFQVPQQGQDSWTYRATWDWSQQVVSTRILHRLQRPVTHQGRLQWIHPRARFKLHSAGPPEGRFRPLEDPHPVRRWARRPIRVLFTRTRADIAAFRHGF